MDGERNHKLWAKRGAVLLPLLMAPAVFAGTVLAPTAPLELPPGPGERYAPSRFGQGPMRIETGVTPGYAERAVTEMEEGDAERASADRSPAGLQFQNEKGKAGAPQVDPVSPQSVAMRKGVQEVALIAGELGFFPKTVFVSRDVPVRMYVTGASKNTLCIMMDSFQVRRQIRSQKIEEITFLPSFPGKYRFHCPINAMEGILIVKEFATNIETNDVNR